MPFKNLKNKVLGFFDIPIQSSGEWISMTHDGETYRINNRPPANGYTYYDKSDGNTYRFINGKRTLYRQGSKSANKTKQNQKIAKQKTSDNKQIDAKISDKLGYGRSVGNTINGWSPIRLKTTIDPNAKWNIEGAIQEGWNYMWNDPLSYRENYKSIPESEAFWYRHLGFQRDLDNMPINGIRFTGDYNPDGTVRLPNAEYTGISKRAKNAIRTLLSNKVIKVPSNGSWVVRKEGYNDDVKALEHLANFSIRENNNSGIYDMYDTYDFDRGEIGELYLPNLNRTNGKQIEVRDTIWGKNAIPELYNINFTTNK